MRCGSVMRSGSRGVRTLTTVPGASSPSRPSSPERRRARRRTDGESSSSSWSSSWVSRPRPSRLMPRSWLRSCPRPPRREEREGRSSRSWSSSSSRESSRRSSRSRRGGSGAMSGAWKKTERDGTARTGAAGDRRLLLVVRGPGVVVLVQGVALRFGGGGRAARLGGEGSGERGRAAGPRRRGRVGAAAREPLEEAGSPPAGVLVSLHHLWCTPQPVGTAAPYPGSSPSGSPRTRLSVDPGLRRPARGFGRAHWYGTGYPPPDVPGGPGLPRERLFMAVVPRGGPTCLPVSHADAHLAVRVGPPPSAMIAA